jgi:hypothetical protein
VINDEAVAYMRERALAGPVIARLLEHPARRFADQAAWNDHLDELGISALKVNPDPVLIATEGALWGSVKAHGQRWHSQRRGRDCRDGFLGLAKTCVKGAETRRRPEDAEWRNW